MQNRELPWYKRFLESWKRRTTPTSTSVTAEQVTPGERELLPYAEAAARGEDLAYVTPPKKYKTSINLSDLTPESQAAIKESLGPMYKEPVPQMFPAGGPTSPDIFVGSPEWVEASWKKTKWDVKQAEALPWSEMPPSLREKKITSIIMDWGPGLLIGGPTAGGLRGALIIAGAKTGFKAGAARVGAKLLIPFAEAEGVPSKVANSLMKLVGERLPQVLTQKAAQTTFKRITNEVIEATEARGGSTFSILTRENLAQKPLFAVSAFPERSYTSFGEKLTKEELDSFIAKNADLLGRPDISLGTWFDKDTKRVVVDVVITTPDRKAALSYAAAHNQKAIYDLANSKQIDILRHYSQVAGKTISPEFMGTGQAGSESKMLQEYKDVFERGDFAKRSYWYEPRQGEEPRFTGQPVSFAERPEKIFSPETASEAEKAAFTAKREELLATKFRPEFGEDFGNLERQAVEVDRATAKALGYEGYTSSGTTSVFKPLETIEPTKYTLPKAPPAPKPKTIFRRGDMVSENIGGSRSIYGLANKKDLEEMAFEPNALKSALQFLAKAPGASRALSIISPQMLQRVPTALEREAMGDGVAAMGTVWRAKILHSQATDIMARQSQQLLSKLYRVGNSKEIFGLTPEGIVTRGVRSKPGTDSIFIMDVLAKPDKYYWTDPAAKEFMEVYNKIGDIQTKALKKAKVKFPEIELGEGEFFVSRRAKGVVNEDGSSSVLDRASTIEGGLRIGSKPYFFKGRDPRSQQEMFQQLGILYESPENTIKARLRMTGKYLANNLVEGDLKGLGTFEGEQGLRSLVTAGSINIPAFRGYATKPELREAADLANRLFAPQKDTIDRLLRIGDDANAAMRFVQTGFDPGFFLVNYQMAAVHPLQYARGFAKGIEVFINPKAINVYRSLPDKVSFWNRMGQTTLAGLDATDVTQAARGTGWITKIPVLNKIGTRFEQAFEFIGYYYRTEIGQALEKTAAKKGSTGLQQLADHLNHLTAVVNTQSMGVVDRQRALEGVAFYAARMKRAGFALFLDAFQGGIRGSEARKALGKWVAGMGAAFTALAYATGQEERLNPNHPQSIFRPDSAGFLNLKIGNTWVGVGGMARQVMRLGGDITEAVTTGEGFAGSMKNLGDAFATWYRSSASPFVGMAWDAFSGHDFIGNRIDTLDKFVAAEAQQFIPFGAATGIDFILNDYDPKTGAIAGATEWLGFPTRPVSLYDRLVAAQLEILKSTDLRAIDGEKITKWDDLNEGQVHDLEVKYPALAAVQQQLSAQYYLNRSDDPARSWYNAKNSVSEKYAQEMLDLVRQLKSGEIDTYEFFKQRSVVKAENRAGKAVAWAMRLDLEGLTNEEKEARYRENQKPEDQALDDYQTIWAEPIVGDYGQIDWDATKKAADDFLVQLPSKIREYVLAHNNDYLDYLPDEVKAVELEIKQRGAEGSGWRGFGGAGSSQVDRLLKGSAPVPKTVQQGGNQIERLLKGSKTR